MKELNKDRIRLSISRYGKITRDIVYLEVSLSAEELANFTNAIEATIKIEEIE